MLARFADYQYCYKVSAYDEMTPRFWRAIKRHWNFGHQPILAICVNHSAACGRAIRGAGSAIHACIKVTVLISHYSKAQPSPHILFLPHGHMLFFLYRRRNSWKHPNQATVLQYPDDCTLPQ